MVSETALNQRAIDPVIVEEVRKSFGRCTTSGDVISVFYDLFLASNPDIKPRFTRTDFAAQKGLLRQGVNLAILHAAGMASGTAGLRRIRDSHSQAKLDVPPALYRHWKASFLSAVAATDPQHTPALQRQWDTVLQHAIDFIVAGY